MITGTDITITAMTDPVSLPALYRLMTFLSPGFPVGAFTYSHGLEQVVDQGTITDAARLEAWLEDILRFGAGRSDAILLKETSPRRPSRRRGDGYRTARTGPDAAAIEGTSPGDQRTGARPSSRPFATAGCREATVRQRTCSWSNRAGDDTSWPYPVAVGLACAAHVIPEEAALTAYLQAFAANLVSAAIRTVPLGQSEGQSVLAGLEPVLFTVVEDAKAAELADLGSSTFLADIASMAHETQYSRLFRLMSSKKRPPACRHRRPGRCRQDHAHRQAVQGHARDLFARRHHQRHLHQRGRRGADALAGADQRPHSRRRDRWLSAHRHPRGRLDQPGGCRRPHQVDPGSGPDPDRIRRRQSCSELLTRAGRSHHLRD